MIERPNQGNIILGVRGRISHLVVRQRPEGRGRAWRARASHVERAGCSGVVNAVSMSPIMSSTSDVARAAAAGRSAPSRLICRECPGPAKSEFPA